MHVYIYKVKCVGLDHIKNSRQQVIRFTEF